MAASYHISKTAIQSLSRERGVALRRQGLSPDQVTEAAHLYKAGQSVAQAARAVNLPTKSVYDALKRAGVQMRPRTEKGRR